MSITINIPDPVGNALNLVLEEGERFFILGANGVGKSSLMHRIRNQHPGNSRRITAHRQTWFSSGSLDLTPHGKRQTDSSIQSYDNSPHARWKDDYGHQRANVAIFELIEAENSRARAIADSIQVDVNSAIEIAKHESPIQTLNRILRLCNIAIEISALPNGDLIAKKGGSEPYSIAELSDGERSALLIAATVLTAPAKTLILVDEPERHLHRSIVSPLINLMFRERPDCTFVVSTHDVYMVVDNPEARVLLVRGCNYLHAAVFGWDADFLELDGQIDESIRTDILGARRRILFIEGEEGSLDKPLYSLIFPGVSILPKAGCRNVEDSVAGIRGNPTLHWAKAFGLVDSDRRSAETVAKLQARGVYALSVYAIESIYYHPKIQRLTASRLRKVDGAPEEERLAAAKDAAIAKIAPNGERLCQKVIERAVRSEIDRNWPSKDQIAAGEAVNIAVDVPAIARRELDNFNAAVGNKDLELLVSRYNVRETGALGAIAEKLGFQGRDQYESAVRTLLAADDDARAFVRSLFGNLPHDLGVQ